MANEDTTAKQQPLDKSTKSAPTAVSGIVKTRAQNEAEQAQIESDPAKANIPLNLAGDYRVKAFRVACGPLVKSDPTNQNEVGRHGEAYRGDIVRLTHDDALSLLRNDAIETEDQYKKRLLSDQREAMTAQMLAAQGTPVQPL